MFKTGAGELRVVPSKGPLFSLAYGAIEGHVQGIPLDYRPGFILQSF